VEAMGHVRVSGANGKMLVSNTGSMRVARVGIETKRKFFSKSTVRLKHDLSACGHLRLPLALATEALLERSAKLSPLINLDCFGQ
jgi:hypothetical protein